MGNREVGLAKKDEILVDDGVVNQCSHFLLVVEVLLLADVDVFLVFFLLFAFINFRILIYETWHLPTNLALNLVRVLRVILCIDFFFATILSYILYLLLLDLLSLRSLNPQNFPPRILVQHFSVEVGALHYVKQEIQVVLPVLVKLEGRLQHHYDIMVKNCLLKDACVSQSPFISLAGFQVVDHVKQLG